MDGPSTADRRWGMGMTADKKKVIVVGATGTIGSQVAAQLADRYDVIRAARSGGDIQVDATSDDSVQAMFHRVGPYDALVSLCGKGSGGRAIALSEEDLINGFRLKVLLQVRLVKLGLETMNDGGSFTLTSGILSREPFPDFSAIAMGNGALEAFCVGASVEMPRGIRINCVMPVFMTETLANAGVVNTQFPKLSAEKTAKAYLWSVDGSFTGRALDARQPAPTA